MEILHIILVSSGSLVILFLLTKIMGNREMSELSMFDYINSITIGSIAAEMATSLEDDFLKPLTAMIVYAIFIVVISMLTNKSILLHRFINGKALILFENGTFYKKNFSKAKLNIAEFLTVCRDKGFFNISEIQTAIIESNGKISILPKSVNRFVTPQDLNLNPPEEYKEFTIIIDGNVLYDNLKTLNKDIKWLNKELKKQKLNIKNVFLATCDLNYKLNAYTYNNQKSKHDPFI